jgi:annexin A7/11
LALALKSNAQIAALKEAYQTHFKKDLEKEVAGDVAGDVRRFFVAMITGSRDESGTSSTVDADVDALHAGGQAKWGTEESIFIRILASKSYGHLAAVSKAYNAKHGKSFAKVIKDEFAGTLEKVLVAFVEAFEDYPTFLANRLEKSMV